MNEKVGWEKQFEEWIESLCRYGHEPLRYVLWSPGEKAADGGARLRAKVFTDRNVYTISATSNYLGSHVAARKARAGETWTRGNDLPDGKFSEETWQRILLGIVRYELVELEGKPDKAGSVDEDSQQPKET